MELGVLEAGRRELTGPGCCGGYRHGGSGGRRRLASASLPFLASAAVHLTAVTLWSSTFRVAGCKEDRVTFCEGGAAADTSVGYSCLPGSRILPSSVTYAATSQLCPAGGSIASGEGSLCYGELGELALTGCVGMEVCGIALPGEVNCNDSLWYPSEATNSYLCVKGDSWHDACFQGPGTYFGDPTFVYFGKSPTACSCLLSLSGPGEIQVLREPIVTAQPHEVVDVAYTMAGFKTSTVVKLTTTIQSRRSSTSTTQTVPTPSLLELDECINLTVSGTISETVTTSINFINTTACLSRYWLVYRITGGSAYSALSIKCNQTSRPTEVPADTTTTGNVTMPTQAPPSSSTSTTLTPEAKVALSAGLAGGLVGAAIAITVLATLVMRLRREKRPRRTSSRISSRKSASRQQSAIVIPDSDYNSRDELGHYYELPVDRRLSTAAPAAASTAEDYTNGYVEVLRDEGGTASAVSAGSQQQPPQGGGLVGAASAQYEIPGTSAESRPGTYYDSLHPEPSTQL